MAINVNTVYQTVLSILNKEQRGYMTPDEFNKVATQVQLEIFENYFNDLNQQLRVPQTDVEYADRQKNIDECLAIFKQFGDTFTTAAGKVLTATVTDGGTGFSDGTNVATTGGNGSGLTVNTTTTGGVIQSVTIANGGSGYSATNTVVVTGGSTDAILTINTVNRQLYFNPPADTYKLGTVIYNNTVELQKVNRNEYLYLNMSPLTKPTTDFPVYIHENGVKGSAGNNTSQPGIYVYPTTITSASDIKVSYIRKPADVVWGFSIGSLGQYLYSASSSTQFELIELEQTNVILRILAYAGVIIKDPQIVQVAAQAVQSEQINSKS